MLCSKTFQHVFFLSQPDFWAVTPFVIIRIVTCLLCVGEFIPHDGITRECKGAHFRTTRYWWPGLLQLFVLFIEQACSVDRVVQPHSHPWHSCGLDQSESLRRATRKACALCQGCDQASVLLKKALETFWRKYWRHHADTTTFGHSMHIWPYTANTPRKILFISWTQCFGDTFAYIMKASVTLWHWLIIQFTQPPLAYMMLMSWC